MAYAENTTVPIDKTRSEIEALLRKYGADQFSSGVDDERGMGVVEFRANSRHVRFVLTLPKPSDKKFHHHSRGRRSKDAALKKWEQACRSRWRALLLSIKAKLESVESGIAEFEEEFLSHVVLPGNKTAGDWLRPQIEVAYESGKMPKSLLALPAPTES